MVPFAVLSLGVALVIPSTASAETTKPRCRNLRGIYANALLEADLVAFAAVTQSSSRRTGTKKKGWKNLWSNTLVLEHAVKGSLPENRTIRVTGRCSGQQRSAVDNCGTGPLAKSPRALVFLKRNFRGRYFLAQPDQAMHWCPGRRFVKRAKKDHPKAFAEVMRSLKERR